MEDVARPPARRIRAWVGVIAYAACISWLSARPVDPRLTRVWLLRQDKLLHLVEYAGFGALLATALGPGLGRVVAATLLAGGFGVIDEWHQSFVPGRHGKDPGDMLADLGGAAIGAAAIARRQRTMR